MISTNTFLEIDNAAILRERLKQIIKRRACYDNYTENPYLIKQSHALPLLCHLAPHKLPNAFIQMNLGFFARHTMFCARIVNHVE